MNKKLRNVLKSEILGIIDRIPESQKLDVNKTFENDQLLGKFYNDEIQSVFTDNRYHSSEISETDNESLKQKILRTFLRDYIDTEFSQASKIRTWYNRSLKSYIRRYSNVNYSSVCEDTNNVEEKDYSHNRNYVDSFEKNNRNSERRNRSLVSMEYNSNYEKDDN
ncbi:14261_t:CDS:2 [Funneliformis mosseae]|uniref:14261_t:CDS:1 n=1 Tax=Funneliformis mosseae TaxID=27381 RepID=A0A9N8VRY6_FUNMO|nr:14261_t:CDS:2 [Funneliformis mosseae]